MTPSKSLQVLGLSALVALAACGPESPTAAPADYLLETAQNPSDGPTQPVGTYVRVCKVSFNDFEDLPDDGTLGTAFDFTTTATGGTVTAPTVSMAATSRLDLDIYVDCPVVWEDPTTPFDDQTLVTLTEAVTPGFQLTDIFYQYPSDGVFRGVDRQGGRSATLTPRDGLVVYFKNVAADTPPPPPPPGGGQGCTPGYWKQPHHYDSWVGLTPTDSYVEVFGVGPDMFLGDALKLKGGKFNALIRHSVAALLSANSPGVSYDLTGAQIISAVQQAYASGQWKSLKNQLDALNNQGCPLN